MTKIIDTHYHLNFITNRSDQSTLIEQLANHNIEVIAQTVLPTQFVDRMLNVKTGLGFHPWWVQTEKQVKEEMNAFKQQLRFTHYIGEIGLDFSTKHAQKKEMQIEVLKEIFTLIDEYSRANQHYFILSIHTVRSAEVVLEMLEKIKTKWLVPIFHYFNGTSDELTRIVRMGGYLSINQKMLLTKKGRAYIKQIPGNRLLLESDMPEYETHYSVEKLVKDVRHSLFETKDAISIIRNVESLPLIIENQRKLFYDDPSKVIDFL